MWHFLTLYLLPLFPFLSLLWSPCGCISCQFFSDDFSSNDIANYTQVSGTWTISGGKLNISNATAILTGSTANPNSDSNTKVSTTCNIATDGDTARIILAYTDSSNYWFAEVQAGSGAYLRIYQRSGGSDTQKATVSITQANASDFTFCASIKDGQFFLTRVGDNLLQWTDTFTATGWGLGTGSGTGARTFDDLTVSVVDDDTCRPCDYCPICNNPETDTPLEIEVVTSGNSDGSGPFACLNCSSLDGTYIIPGVWSPPKNGLGTGGCSWELPISVTACNNTANTVNRVVSAISVVGGSYKATIHFTKDNVGGLNIQWTQTAAGTTAPLDCTSAINQAYSPDGTVFCIRGTASATVIA